MGKMRRLREFVRRHKTYKEDADASPPPIPSLPRPPNVHPAAREVSPQDQSAFFQLPTEIRMKILRAAFGDRTIHIDFRFRPPLYTYETSGGHEPGHGGYPPLAHFSSGYGPNGVRRDLNGMPPPKQKPRGLPAWRWYSCVCHRNMPDEWRDWRHFYPVLVRDDLCLEGVTQRCLYWPSTDPERCQVGIMGFLLSCKQGYEDTWDVICSTNTIFIQDHPLVGGLLRQYTVPDAPILTGLYMHRITSLIMRCDLTLFGSIRDTDEVEQRARFAEYLDLIPRAFPKLTHLQLNLGPETYRGRVAPWDGLDEIEDVLLKPLLEMSNKIKGLRDFTALLPLCLSSLFIFEKAWEESLLAVAAETNPVFIEKVWYPFTAKVEGCEQPGTGYWIGEGLANACGWRPDGTTYFLMAPHVTPAGMGY